MIGTFVTTKFEDRSALIARRPFEVVESRNSFVVGGLSWMWSMMAGELRADDGTLTDHVGSGRIVVGDGTQPYQPGDTRLTGDATAQAELDTGFPTVNEGTITFQATFGEAVAVFDWQERGVVTAQGVLLDRSVADQGRKVLGAVWQVQAILELTA